MVQSAAEIDGCLILGAGFPFFRGGITKHLDQSGVSERVLGTTLASLGTTGDQSRARVPTPAAAKRTPSRARR